MSIVTDPDLLKRLEGQPVTLSDSDVVSDPALLAKLEGGTPQTNTIAPVASHTPGKLVAPELVKFAAPGAEPETVQGTASPSDRKASESLRTFVKKDVPAVASTFGAKVGAGLEQSLGGLIQSMGEAQGEEYPGYLPPAEDAAAVAAMKAQKEGMLSTGKELGTEGRAISTEVEKDKPLQTRAGKILSSTAESIGANLPGMAATMVTGVPALGLTAMGLQTFGQAYDEARSKGVSVPEALTSASIQGGSEVATELAPFMQLAKFLKPGKLTTNVLKYYLSDVPGEHLATAIQNATGKAFDRPGMTDKEKWKAAVDYWGSREHGQDQIDTFFTTLLQGFVMGGMAKTARMGAGIQSPQIPDLTAGIEFIPPTLPPGVDPARFARLQSIMEADIPAAAAERLAARQQQPVYTEQPEQPVNWDEYGVQFDEQGNPIDEGGDTNGQEERRREEVLNAQEPAPTGSEPVTDPEILARLEPSAENLDYTSNDVAVDPNRLNFEIGLIKNKKTSKTAVLLPPATTPEEARQIAANAKMKAVRVGQELYIYDPSQISESSVRRQAKTGNGVMLGYGTPTVPENGVPYAVDLDGHGTVSPAEIVDMRNSGRLGFSGVAPDLIHAVAKIREMGRDDADVRGLVPEPAMVAPAPMSESQPETNLGVQASEAAQVVVPQPTPSGIPQISREDAIAAKQQVVSELATVDPESTRAMQLQILLDQYNQIIGGEAAYQDFQAPAIGGTSEPNVQAAVPEKPQVRQDVPESRDVPVVQGKSDVSESEAAGGGGESVIQPRQATPEQRQVLVDGLKSGKIKYSDIIRTKDGKFTVWSYDGAIHAYTEGPINRAKITATLENNLPQPEPAPVTVQTKPANPAPKVDRQKDDIIVAISKLGGIDTAQASREWGSLVKDNAKDLAKHVLQQTRRFGHVFKKTGLPLDQMRETLIGHGYLPEGASINDLYDAIDNHTRGRSTVSTERDLGDEADRMAKEYEDRLLEAIDDDVLDKISFDEFSEDEANAFHLIVQAEIDDVVSRVYNENTTPSPEEFAANYMEAQDAFWREYDANERGSKGGTGEVEPVVKAEGGSRGEESNQAGGVEGRQGEIPSVDDFERMLDEAAGPTRGRDLFTPQELAEFDRLGIDVSHVPEQYKASALQQLNFQKEQESKLSAPDYNAKVQAEYDRIARQQAIVKETGNGAIRKIGKKYEVEWRNGVLKTYPTQAEAERALMIEQPATSETTDASGWKQDVAVKGNNRAPTIGAVQKQGGKRASTSDLMDAFTPEPAGLFDQSAKEEEAQYNEGHEDTPYTVNEVLPADTGGNRSGDANGVREQFALFTPSGSPTPQAEQVAAVARQEVKAFSKSARVITGHIATGITSVNNPGDLAHLMAGIRKKTQENFVAVITDKDGNILSVSDQTTGTLNQSLAHPALTLGVASLTDGAANVWVVHNHPSGDPTFSQEDLAISKRFADASNGTGIKYHGIMAIGKSTASFFDGQDSVKVTIPPMARRLKVPVEGARIFTKRPAENQERLTAPDQIPDLLSGMGIGGEGVVLLDGKNRVVGFVPMAGKDMGLLRTGNLDSGAGLLTKTIRQVNAAAMVAVTPEMQKARNLGKYGDVLGVKLLDIYNPESGKSAAMTGRDITSGNSTFFSLVKPQAETPEFKRWFGDSKVVDADGKPLVVYHGSPDVRGILREGFAKQLGRKDSFFATDSYAMADSYADDRRAFDYQNAEPHTIALYLSMQNPLVVDAKGANWKETEKHLSEAQTKGHDGIIIKNSVDFYNNAKGAKPATVYVFFRSSQAKSAMTGKLLSRVDGITLADDMANNGQFDSNNPDIRYSMADGGTLDHQAITRVTDLIAKALPGNVTLNIVDHITPPADAATAFAAHGKTAGNIAGMHQAAKSITTGEIRSIITLAMDGATYRTGYHEVMHAAEAMGLLSAKDIGILERQYPTKDGVSSSERRADAFADHAAGKSAAKGYARLLFDRIKAFLRKVKSLLTGQGWRTADDVFNDLMGGKLKRNAQEVAVPDAGTQFMTAWHGSPHDFDKFTTEKIGTGEGAQAYGSGLYFASSRGVAEYYRESLAGGGRGGLSLAGIVPSSPGEGLSDNAWGAAKNLSKLLVADTGVIKSFGSLDVVEQGRVLSMMHTLLEEDKVLNAVVGLVPIDVVNVLGGKEYAPDYLLKNPTMLVYLLPRNADNLVSGSVKAIDVLAPLVAVAAAKIHTRLRRFNVSPNDMVPTTGADGHVIPPNVLSKIPSPSEFVKGRLYQVELAPKEDEYLLWDKPLSEQSEKVKDALEIEDPKQISDKMLMHRAKIYLQSKEVESDARADIGARDSLRKIYNAFQEGPEALRGLLSDTSLPAYRLRKIFGEGYSEPGYKLYGQLKKEKGSDIAASAYLHSLGIRGIKYLDGSSRGKGDGNYNYVIFNDEDVAITSKFSLADKFTSSSPEVQARRDAAHGLDKGPGLIDRIKETIDRAMKETQHFPELDMKRDAQTADILRVFEASRQAATAKTVAYLNQLTGSLNTKEMDAFEWRVLLDDLNEESGKGHDLPFGYTPETLAVDHARIVEMTDGNEKIKAAVEKRHAEQKRIVKELVTAGILPESVMESKNYFRHMVLEYANAKKWAGLGTAALRNKKRGWQKQRQGSELDINTNFLEAEFEVYSQQLKELATKDALDKVERINNIAPKLKRQAKATNFENLVGGPDIVRRIRRLEGEAAELRAGDIDNGVKQQLAAITQELDELDPTRPFKRSMAIGFSKLEKLAKRGALPEGKLKGMAEALANGEPTEKLFNYISYLAGTDGEGALPARQILKAVANMDKLYRTALGDEYLEHRSFIDKRLMPEGYAEWQPEKGNVFHRETTLPEQIVNKAIEATWSIEELVNSGLLKDAVVLGGRKRTLVLPEGVALTLDNLRFERDTAVLDNVNKKLVGAWKIWTLLSPRRVIKYNLNNMSGDLDAALAADPKILKYMREAWQGALTRRKGNLSAEDRDMLDRGVLDSGISVNEIPDINQLPIFKDLTDEQRQRKIWTALSKGDLSALAPTSLVAKYFDKISGLTNIREALLREAAYRRALELLKQGKPVMWASNPAEIAAIPDLKDKAAKLSRELIGDYGNISAHGERIRARYLPFWSWMEINAPRYIRIFRNAAQNGGRYSTGARIAGVAGKKFIGTTAGVVEKLVLTQMLFALATAFNHLVHGDDDDELDQKQLHLIMGKDSDGRIMSVRFQGAFSDALSWFGLEDYPESIRKMKDGSMDAWDLGRKMALATPNKLVNAALPFVKLAGETITGKTIYPDATKPRAIRDRGEHLARFLSLDNEYRAAAGKPSRGYADSLKNILFYTSDPREQAYNDMRGEAMKWMEKQGKEMPGGDPTAKSNALYYFKQAQRFGDAEAARKYLQKYQELGGTAKGLETSIRNASPLAATGKYTPAFVQSLSPAQQMKLKLAMEFYEEVYGK